MRFLPSKLISSATSSTSFESGRGRAMRAAEAQACLTPIPFDRREGMTLAEAAGVAGKSPGTIRNWCVQHDFGRRVGGRTWLVSKVVLARPEGVAGISRRQSGRSDRDCLFQTGRPRGSDRTLT
jgi:hypothetical protein